MNQPRLQRTAPSDAKSTRDEEVALARQLLTEAGDATLATSFTGARPEERGWPYASLVMMARDEDGQPILLLSDLAEHTRNLKAEPRVSLLIDGTKAQANRLAGSRLTVLGRATIVTDAVARDRMQRAYVSRHPDAAAYAGFKDFHFYKVSIDRAHLVGGFGKIRWIEAEALLGPTA